MTVIKIEHLNTDAFKWCDVCDKSLKYHVIRLDDMLATLTFPTDVEKERVHVRICHECIDKMRTMLEHEQRSK